MLTGSSHEVLPVPEVHRNLHHLSITKRFVDKNQKAYQNCQKFCTSNRHHAKLFNNRINMTNLEKGFCYSMIGMKLDTEDRLDSRPRIYS